MARQLRVEIIGDASSLSRAFRDATGHSNRFGSALGLLAKASVAGFGAVGAGLALSVKSAVDFEKEMRNVNSIARLGEGEFKALGKSVTGMAAEVGQKPKVLARGLYDIVSSGFKASEAVKVLRVSAKAATAGLTDTATASKAVTAALNAYHLGADKARKVSDVLFQTVNKGVLTFEELSQQMGDLVPVAAPLGVKLEEVGAAMSTLTLQGVPAAEAATRVKSVMIQLAKPSEALTGLLKEQGFASGEAAVKSLGFAGVLEMLSKATSGSVTEAAKLTPEIRSLMGIVGLTGRNLKTYNEHLAAMKQAQEGAGVTAGVFAEQSKSVAVMWQKASAALDVFKIQVGAALLPALTVALGALSKLFTKLNAAEGFHAKLNVVWEGVSKVAGEMWAKIKKAVEGDERKIFINTEKKFELVGEKGFGDKIKEKLDGVDWGGVFSHANAEASLGSDQVWDSLLTPGLERAAERAKEWAKGLPGKVASDFRAALNMADISRDLNTWIVRPLQAITGPAESMAQRLGFSVGRGWISSIPAAFSAAVQMGDRLVAGVRGRLGALPGIVLGQLTRGVIGPIGSVAALAYAASGNIGRRIVTGVRSGLGNLIGAVLGKLNGIITAVATTAANAFSAAVAIGWSIVRGVISGLAGLARQVGSKIASEARSAIDWARRNLGSTAEEYASAQLGKPIASGVFIGWVLGTRDLPTKMSETLRKAVEQVRGSLSMNQALNLAMDLLGKGVVRGWITSTSDLPSKMSETLKNAIERARKVVEGAREKLASAFEGLTARILRAFDAQTSGHETATEQLLREQDERRTMENLIQAQTDAQVKLNEAIAAGDAAAIAAAQRDLTRAGEDIERVGLEKQAAAERLAWDSSREELKIALEKRLEVLGEHWKKVGVNSQTALNDLNALLLALGVTSFAASGKQIGDSFVAALLAAISTAAGAAASLGATITTAAGAIPKMATGGIVTKPTVVLAGESGPEAIVPLNRSGSFAGGGDTLVINNYAPIWSEREFDDLVRSATWKARNRGGL